MTEKPSDARASRIPLEDYPAVIRACAERYYAEDDAVHDAEKICRQIETEVWSLVVSQQAAGGGALYSSDVKRKAAQRAMLDERQDYQEARDRVRKLANARNVTAAELEERRGEFAVLLIAARRELVAQEVG